MTSQVHHKKSERRKGIVWSILSIMKDQYCFYQGENELISQCLKITEKVAFNIASEASYVYILSGQKFIKNAKNGQFWRVFENLKLAVKQCYQICQNHARIEKSK